MVWDISLNVLEGIHAKELLLGLNCLRQRWDLCDVELHAGKTRIPAHRAVLSACSSYFASMFTTDLTESRKRVIDMKEVDENALKMIVDFVYTGKVDITCNNVQTVLPLADLVELAGVKEVCEAFLAEQLHPSNALGIAKFAEAYSCMKLHELAIKYIEEHFDSVTESEEFLELSTTEICDLIKSNNLNTSSEMVIYNAVESWVRHEVVSRSCHFAKLLGHVRLPLLPTRFLIHKVESNPLVMQNADCRQLIQDALSLWTCKAKRCSKKEMLAFQPRRPPQFLLAVGGKCGFFATLNSTEKFDLATKHWSTVGYMGARRYEFGVGFLKGKAYATGGLVSGVTSHCGTPYSVCGNSVEAYCIKDDVWSSVAPLQQARSNHCVAVLGGKLYVLGGYDGQRYLNSVECYSAEENTWTNVCAMKYCRSGFAAVVLEECIYALGGYGPKYHCTVEKYDPGEDCWEMVPAMSTHRINFGAGTLHGYLYVIGGHDGVRHLRSVERFDPITNEWTSMSPLPHSRTGLSVTSFDGMLYALGGHDGSSYQCEVWCYDPCTDSWSFSSEMNASRCSFGLTAF